MSKNYILDEDEKELLEQIENGDFLEDLSELENLKIAAKNTMEKMKGLIKDSLKS